VIARAALALALCAATACSDAADRCVVPADVEPDWVRRIGCEGDAEPLWAERDDAVFARTRSINWMIDREQDDRVYFINTVRFDLHYDFAAAYLNLEGTTPVGTHAEFNLLNYRRSERRFVMGKLVSYVDQDLLTIEMSAGDTADVEMIAGAFERVRDSIGASGWARELVYRPVSASQEASLDEIAARIPVIRTEEVFRGQTYQPLNPVVGYGTLRFRKVSELTGRPLSPTDIAVLDRVPTDLALVSGVITGEFQTPLSHVNILSKNRGTPNMALRDAFTDPALRALEGELVLLAVSPQGHSVTPASLADGRAFWDQLRPETALVPNFEEATIGLVDLAGLGADASITIGAKAANLAELARVSGGALPLPATPTAIPFSAYTAHVEAAGLAPLIDQLIADVAAGAVEPGELRSRLFDLRWRIFRAPMDPGLAAELASTIETRWGATTRMRFRSSTNVEDLPGFSGAGLYTSAGADLGEGVRAIEDAVKVVWASAWNHQAFIERDFYRVDHRRVRMAVLLHPAFEDELANGVALTINEFADNRPAYYINSQAGEISVTNPTGLATPEQILYYTWYEEPEYEVITRSSITGGAGVLSEEHLSALASHLGAIHAHFKSLLGSAAVDFAMDVEFKVDAAGNLIIKQARPLERR
jgi:hypothetical protein